MSRFSGHFYFVALPACLKQGEKMKMQVSETNGHAFA
jgi:hypothetical protein